VSLLTIKSPDEPVPWPCVQERTKLPKYQPLQPGSDEAYDRIRSWYEICRESHDICNEYGVGQGPSRLLFIDHQSPNKTNTVRLVKYDAGLPSRYVALSHCWGRASDHLQTTLDNLDEHTAKIDIASLSRTFQDAVAICQRLGVAYLWIDSLCIVQDDHEGKAAEIERMESIFQGATLTISAMSARDGRGGCWIPRERVFEIPINATQSVKLAFRRVREPSTEHAAFLTEFADEFLRTEYPLSTRKWALQERVLSRRVIHFTDSELVWECRTRSSCECRDLDNKRFRSTQQKVYDALNRPQPDRRELIREWLKLLEAYSRGDLTRETDALPAIAGLARKFSDKGLGDYFAGLWTNQLAKSLCWFSRPWANDLKENIRAATYVAPSWSWASIRGPLCFDAWDKYDTGDEGSPDCSPEVLAHPVRPTDSQDSSARIDRDGSDSEDLDLKKWRVRINFQLPSPQCASQSWRSPPCVDGSNRDGGNESTIVARVVLTSVGYEPIKNNDFGRIGSGVLTISTRLWFVRDPISRNSILDSEEVEYVPDTSSDVQFPAECVVALILERRCDWLESNAEDAVMSGCGPSRRNWKGQALVLVPLEEDVDGIKYRRCGLLFLPEEALDCFGDSFWEVSIV